MSDQAGSPDTTSDLLCQLSGAADGSIKCAVPPDVKSPFEGLPALREFYDSRTRSISHPDSSPSAWHTCMDEACARVEVHALDIFEVS